MIKDDESHGPNANPSRPLKHLDKREKQMAKQIIKTEQNYTELIELSRGDFDSRNNNELYILDPQMSINKFDANNEFEKIQTGLVSLTSGNPKYKKVTSAAKQLVVDSSIASGNKTSAGIIEKMNTARRNFRNETSPYVAYGTGDNSHKPSPDPARMTGQVGEGKMNYKKKADTPPISNEAKALGIFTDNTSISMTDMAKQLGVNRSSLYRMPILKAAREVHKETQKGTIPRGTKTKNGDMEAWS